MPDLTRLTNHLKNEVDKEIRAKRPPNQAITTDACPHGWQYFSPNFGVPYKKCRKCGECH